MKVTIEYGKVQPEPKERRWMKEVEDGCVVEYEEMCVHGAAYPMFEFDEVIDG